ncbi:MAG: beta-L-arabinofuranosidase domain-containing protein [bacterium]
MKYIGRRDFVASAVLLAVAAPVLQQLRAGVQSTEFVDPRWIGLPRSPAVVPFDLHRVRLREGPQLAALTMNRQFIMGLDPDRLRHVFRANAGLPSFAEPLGGWERR